MTVSERIPFSGLLLPLQKGYSYSCDRRTTDGMELLFISREDGRLRYYFESDMQEFDRKAASDTYSLTVFPRPNGDGKVNTNGDGKVNTNDVGKLNAHAKGKTLLW